MSYLEVYRISRAELLEIARPFPIGWAKIRWEALRLALLRTIVRAKQEVKMTQKSDALSATPEQGDTITPPGGENGSPSSPPRSRVSPSDAKEGSPDGNGKKSFFDVFEQKSAVEQLSGGGEYHADSSVQFARSLNRMQGAVNPDAIEERPSMHLLARGLDRVRSDVEEIKTAVEFLTQTLLQPHQRERRKSNKVGEDTQSNKAQDRRITADMLGGLY